MKYLLDTHAFIWMDSDPARLSSRVTAICQDSTQTLLLSMASVWEMQIKLQAGKLTLPAPLVQIVENQRQANRIGLLPIELSHVLGLANLPAHHQDPFDRILVAQAVVEGLALISHDPRLALYPVSVVW
jgi:PIN domain nuclease of toxin-antitoxin system